MIHGSVVHDPTGAYDDLPLDRTLHEELVRTVLAWMPQDRTTLRQADIDQAELQLTGYLRLLAREVHTELAALPQDPEILARAGAERTRTTLAETVRRLGAAPVRAHRGLGQAQSRARLVQALHTALDRTRAAAPRPVPVPGP
ncbi:restriction endonuclease [Streptomyces sp. NPDC085463]|uniref:restriction endonuclease n=1 Tax=Streptomyces sp. NPDC085463 TaxID=3365724 RepID=UPI0037D13F1D